MLLSPLFITLLVSFTSAQTVYLIRHGEKPADDDVTGLSAAGVQRSQCLRNVFGSSSPYNIGYILAQTPKASTYKYTIYRYLFALEPSHFPAPLTSILGQKDCT